MLADVVRRKGATAGSLDVGLERVEGLAWFDGLASVFPRLRRYWGLARWSAGCSRCHDTHC